MRYTVNGKEYDTYSVRNQAIMDKLVCREVYCCMTQEVEYMLSRIFENDDNNPFDESVYSEMAQPACPSCGSTYGFSETTVGELPDADFQKYIYGYDEDNNEQSGFLCPVCGVCHDTIQEARECCGEDYPMYICDECGEVFTGDFRYFDTDIPEIYEWWAVSVWFGEKLKERGQVVIESYGKSYWGRQCTGQAISLDGVIVGIAKDMGILVGMENDWSDHL